MELNNADIYLAGELIGFTAGLVISGLFLSLAIASFRQAGTPLANVMLGLSAVAWNLGALCDGIAVVFGSATEASPLAWAFGLKLAGMMTWPIPALAVWRHYAERRWQRLGCWILQGAAVVMLLAQLPAIVDLLRADSPGGHYILMKGRAGDFLSVYGLSLLAFGTCILIWGGTRSREVWFSYLTVLAGILGVSVGLFLHRAFDLSPTLDASVVLLSRQSSLLIVLGSFFSSARFRLADAFIRQSTWIVVASVLAVAFVVIANSPVCAELTANATSPAAAQIFSNSILVALLLLVFALAGRSAATRVERWLYHVPDYRSVAQGFNEQIRHLQLEPEIFLAAERAARDTLRLATAKIVAVDQVAPLVGSPAQAPTALIELRPMDSRRCCLPEPDVDVLLPITAGGRVDHYLSAGAGQARRSLVAREVDCLRSIAALTGQRLDALRLEREHVERRSREAMLLQQVTEAELRALRAQINPHFLFNSLNTIADLIVTDPPRAETMTLRLAQAFRHVLAHSARPLTSIGEEMDFLRTYLYIEEARFGDRLTVEIDVEPRVAQQRIPSLILQPVVENALKHGLAPKIGPGHLRIAAAPFEGQIRLTVEDDGVGSTTSRPPVTKRAHTGVGLRNVTERLLALYQGRAHLQLEAREGGGSCVTILIPLGEVAG